MQDEEETGMRKAESAPAFPPSDWELCKRQFCVFWPPDGGMDLQIKAERGKRKAENKGVCEWRG